jgi:hypothetical protein
MSLIERSATICTGCWQVVAIDGENNRERIGALCSHLAPMVEVVPSTDTPGAVDRVAELEADLVRVRESRDAWRLQAMREHDEHDGQ